MLYGKRLKLIAVVAIAASMAVPAFAHKGAMGIVKERMDAMSAMKDAVAIIGNMLSGKTDYDRQIALNAAGELQRHGLRVVDQFPDNEESRHKASEATDMVWTDKARFDALANEFNIAAEELRLALTLGERDLIKARFAETGKACSACHEDFRKREE